MHSKIQESQETQTSIPLTLVLTKTHTRRASDLVPNLGSGLAQQKEADYSLSLSLAFHLFIFAWFHSTRAVAHFTSVFKLKLQFEGAAGFSEPQGSICSRPAVLRLSAGCLVDTIYTSWHQNLCKVHSVTFEHLLNVSSSVSAWTIPSPVTIFG